MRTLLCTLGIALAAVTSAPVVHADEEQNSVIRVQPKEAPVAQQGFLRAGRARDIVGIDILDVSNISGNNPTSTIDPIAAEDPERAGIQNDDGGNNDNNAGAGLAACLGTFQMLEDLAGAGAGLFFASLDIDANNGDCQARADSNGQALVAQFDNTIVPPGNAQFFAFGVFSLQPVAFVNSPLGVPITVTTVAATGLRVEITVVVNQVGANFFMTIQNIQQV